MDDLILKKLKEIFGDENVTDDPALMESYSKDQSFDKGCRPQVAVYPESSEQVQDIITFANEQIIPVVPKSSKVSLHGGSLPKEGGILLDLKNMNKILEVDEKNWYAVIEPGVTFKQLNDELKGRGFRIAKPFLDPPSASVVSSFMERNPVATAADFTYGTEHIVVYKVISPTGEPFTIGHPPLENTPAAAPDGPGINFYRIFQGAQGSLGIVTWLIIRILPIEKAKNALFFPCDTIEKAAEVMRAIQKKELGLECFALNDFDLASLLVDETADQGKLLREGTYIENCGAPAWDEDQFEQFNELQNRLPAWTVMVSLSAVGPIPEEKIAYQELDLKDVGVEVGIEPRPTVGGIADLERLMLDELNFSWRMQKRFGYKGSCQQIMFSIAPDRVGELNDIIQNVVSGFNYPPEDIGVFLLPMERARAFYLSVDLHCDPEDSEETAYVRDLYEKLSSALIEKGAFFDRPYGMWSEMVYSRTGKYSEYLRKVKNELDPHNIMNPGKLCY